VMAGAKNIQEVELLGSAEPGALGGDSGKVHGGVEAVLTRPGPQESWMRTFLAAGFLDGRVTVGIVWSSVAHQEGEACRPSCRWPRRRTQPPEFNLTGIRKLNAFLLERRKGERADPGHLTAVFLNVAMGQDNQAEAIGISKIVVERIGPNGAANCMQV